MKWKLEVCPFCFEETLHRIRKRVAPSRDKKRTGAIVKRVVYHCTKCNKRRKKK